MEEAKRKRANGTYRWSQQQTINLLTAIVEAVKSNPEYFEKPTAQRFYDRIASSTPVIASIKWDMMRSKMRHLKNSYLAALKWKGQTGAGLLENGEEKTVEDYIKTLCPFFEFLDVIFGQLLNIQPPGIYQSTQSVEAPQISIQDEVLDIEDFEIDYIVDSPSDTLTCTLQSASASPQQMSSSSTPLSTPPQNRVKKKNLKRSTNSNPFSMLFEIQKQKVDIEKEKLELEKTKENNRFELQKLQLEKEERVEMERLRLQSQGHIIIN